jgi:hypothetical protein
MDVFHYRKQLLDVTAMRVLFDLSVVRGYTKIQRSPDFGNGNTRWLG